MIEIKVKNKTEKVEKEQLKRILQKYNAIAVKINGEIIDLNEVNDNEVIELVKLDTPEGLKIYRHSTSHVMAHAVKILFPKVKIAIGPATEDGFYYDFDIDTPFRPEDLKKIEQKMKEIIKSNNPFIKRILKKEDAIRLFEEKGEHYKVEILKDIKEEEVSIYEEGDFIDLCRGPHLPSTGYIKAFKLLNIAGAYWRGNENNKMLQRIYGTAFSNKNELEKYLKFLEEIKKRDHRRLGKELDLFSINDEIGAGLVLWHPDGAIIRKCIEDFWVEEHLKVDYNILYTPHIAKLNLWKKSGHWDFYRENMYSPMDIEGINYELKPMNCPFHIAIYKSNLRSYRELPIRYAELGTVYRYERSGVLHGLLRVRGFTQDDAHIFCRDDQIEEEIFNIIEFTIFILKTFGFNNYEIYLSTRPEKFVGTEENWQKATNALISALKKKSLQYEIDPGEGVFYGPKIDIKVKDSLGRAWQCSTIQVDFNSPERFKVTYKGADGKDHIPIMIHRALMGSLERFFGILIEHYAGAFPLWLSPVQIAVITVADRHIEYANKLVRCFKNYKIRVKSFFENEKVGYKLRTAIVRKIPYSVIIGDKEISTEELFIRKRTGEQTGPYKLEELIKKLKEEINKKSLKSVL